jgi:hypothetical protein
MASAPYWKVKQNSIYLDAGPKNDLLTVIITRFTDNPLVFLPGKLPYTLVALGLLQAPFTAAILAYNENRSLANENALIDQVAIINPVFYEIYDFVDGTAGGSKTIVNLAGLEAYKHVSTSTGKPLQSLNVLLSTIKGVIQKLAFTQRAKPTTKGTLIISSTIPGGLTLTNDADDQIGIVTPLGVINLNLIMKNNTEIKCADTGKKLAGTSFPFNNSGFGPGSTLNPTMVS